MSHGLYNSLLKEFLETGVNIPETDNLINDIFEVW
jgi:hypothetical protein